jgi:hypothetical protein
MDWKVLFEAVKEPLRLLLLALITWLITYIIPGVQDPTWNAVLLLVLRFIDKWLHEWGKATENTIATRGLTQF